MSKIHPMRIKNPAGHPESLSSNLLNKGIRYVLTTGLMLSPSWVFAQGGGVHHAPARHTTPARPHAPGRIPQTERAVIQQLQEQLQDYQEQLSSTNARLQELEKKNTEKTQRKSSKNTDYNTDEAAAAEDSATRKIPHENVLKSFYDGGFKLKTDDNRYSIAINGLAQARYTLNLPDKYTGTESNTFDLALGRLFFSGTVFDPNLSYFFFYQTTTLADTNRVDTIDWWGKYQLGDWGIKAGRILPQYSRQFYTDIGKYLFMDLQAPEYAFSLQRTPGVEVSWHADKWTLSLTAGNSIRGLDSVTQQNTDLKLAGVGRVVYDVLDPYTYVPACKTPLPARKPGTARSILVIATSCSIPKPPYSGGKISVLKTPGRRPAITMAGTGRPAISCYPNDWNWQARPIRFHLRFLMAAVTKTKPWVPLV
jgi:hypothetical protein